MAVSLAAAVAPSYGAERGQAALAPPAGAKGADIADLRTQTSRTFSTGRGTFATQIGTESLNFRDASGRWKPVDNALEGDGAVLRNAANQYRVSIPRRLNGGAVRVTRGNAWIEFAPRGATNRAATARGAAAGFAGAWPGVELRYTATGDTVKEELIVRDRASVRDFAFDVRAPAGFTLKASASGTIVVRDSEGAVRMLLSRSMMLDAEGEYHGVRTDLRREADGWRLVLRPDRRWLAARDRAWPVTIDPSVYVGGGLDCTQGSAPSCAQLACSIFNEVGPGGECGQVLPVWEDEAAGWAWRTMLRWDLTGLLPAGTTVRKATMDLRAYYEYAPNSDFEIYRVTQPWTSDVSWTTSDGTTPWTPGGPLDGPYEPADLTALVSGWWTGQTPNHGLAVQLPGRHGWGDGAHIDPLLTIQYSGPGPNLGLDGELWTQTADPTTGQDHFGLNLSAQAHSAPLDRIEVRVDGALQETFTGTDCGTTCTTIADEWYLYTDPLSEGSHQIQAVVFDQAGLTDSHTWTISVPRENHYATMLASWRTAIQGSVDVRSPAPLTGPMPLPPDDWDTPQQCEADDTALRDCYDAITDWGADVQEWLTDNLPYGGDADLLWQPPVFTYSVSDDTARDLTFRMRDAFVFARHFVAHPNQSLDVAIGFHEPLDPSEVEAALPDHSALQVESAIDGYFEPEVASLGGSGRVTSPSSVPDSIEDFYAQQVDLAEANIDELENETPTDPDDADAIAAELSDLNRFKDQLDDRGAFVTGITVRLNPSGAQVALRSAAVTPSATSQIKSMSVLAPGTSVAAGGAQRLSEMSIDAQTVADAGGGAAARSASVPADQKTCAQAGQIGLIKASNQEPNPVYWAPSYHKADTVLGPRDGDDGLHQKRHRLRWKWLSSVSLAWMCAAEPTQRNVEIEARVFPSPTARWSKNWESHFTSRYTQGNLPGKGRYQDDIADGDDRLQDNPVDPQKYPDFAIVAKSGHFYRYNKRYWVDFTTNEGETDSGTVIYSAQATSTSVGTNESTYCGVIQQLRYVSCTFGRVTVCYDYAAISAGPVTQPDAQWIQKLGGSPRLTEVAADPGHRVHLEYSGGKQTREITSFCDPKPPGADDS
ncbi:DNRLRE domain-containing protein [Solirubrobacter phytolaccae]|uniref:DNRLRE domain-containing protein n=1 Tax=Solirubrobacter phytolaccae TaxID=1404360 RepID=A0A9X3SCG8_9ACTN|nr:DNRLRE domain-containing protein [Solirubrobacter phytolaccae]MDA0184671.1 DNRLRE domain-containing protein [Solirubrobacter phytolaccae]